MALGTLTAWKIGWYDNQIAAQLLCTECRHRRPNTELARRIITGAQHAAPIAGAAHGQRHIPPFGMVAHFYSGIKAVAIDMNDFALNQHGSFAEQIKRIVRSFYLKFTYFCIATDKR